MSGCLGPLSTQLSCEGSHPTAVMLFCLSVLVHKNMWALTTNWCGGSVLIHLVKILPTSTLHSADAAVCTNCAVVHGHGVV